MERLEQYIRRVRRFFISLRRRPLRVDRNEDQGMQGPYEFCLQYFRGDQPVGQSVHLVCAYPIASVYLPEAEAETGERREAGRTPATPDINKLLPRRS